MTKRQMVSEIIKGCNFACNDYAIAVRVAKNTRKRIEEVYNYFNTTNKTHEDSLFSAYCL